MAVVRSNTEDVGAEQRACTNHSARQTLVACGRCLRPFCIDCLIHTPAGQRCFECAGVRRDYAQRAATRRFLVGFSAMLLGAAISALLGRSLGFYGLFIAGIAGSAAGQAMSPTITRHNRPWVYVPAVFVLFLGAWLGYSIGLVARELMAGAARGRPLDPLSALLAPIFVLYDPSVWIFFCIAAIVAYLRMR